MNIQDLGSIGEIVAAIATIGTLIYLAIQIRSNTTAIKASSNWDSHHTFAEVNDYLAQGSPLSELVFRSTDPDVSLSDFSEYEQFQLQMFGRGMFQRLEAQFFLHKEGLLEPRIWANRRRFNRAFIDLPVWREFWETEAENFQFTEEFIRSINEADKDNIIFLGQTRDDDN